MGITHPLERGIIAQNSSFPMVVGGPMIRVDRLAYHSVALMRCDGIHAGPISVPIVSMKSGLEAIEEACGSVSRFSDRLMNQKLSGLQHRFVEM